MASGHNEAQLHVFDDRNTDYRLAEFFNPNYQGEPIRPNEFFTRTNVLWRDGLREVTLKIPLGETVDGLSLALQNIATTEQKTTLYT